MTELDIMVGYETPAPFKFVRGEGWQEPHGDYPGADAIRALTRQAAEAPKRCDTCRLWTRLGGAGADMGECTVHLQAGNVPWLFGYGSDCDVEYHTPYDWHCAGWQPRSAPDAEGGAG